MQRGGIMLAKWLRRWFGSIRLFLTLLAAVSGLVVVGLDIWLRIGVSAQAYGFLTALVAAVAVFVVKDSDRPAGKLPNGQDWPGID